jgi:hypothetical protein
VDEDGDQTGLPYVYGNWVNSKDDHRFNGYLNADSLTLRGSKPNQWGVVYAIYPVPEETGAIRLFLQSADGGKPHNGSAAFFDDVGVYSAASEAEAKQLLEAYRGKALAMAVAPSAKAPKPVAVAKQPGPSKAATAPVIQQGGLAGHGYVGRTLEDVRTELGYPKMQFKRGSRTVLVYDGREISSSDGQVVDRDSGGDGALQ